MDAGAIGRLAVEFRPAFNLPGDKSNTGQTGGGQLTGETAECRTDPAAHVQDVIRLLRLKAQTGEDFAVHLLQHRLEAERVHAAAEVAEVHVEVRAPGSVVGPRIGVVALEVYWCVEV